MLSVRPEDLEVRAAGTGHIDGIVTFVRDLGATVETFIEVEGQTLNAVATTRHAQHEKIEERVGLKFAADDMVLLSQ